MIKLDLLPPEYRKKRHIAAFERAPGIHSVPLKWVTQIPLRRLYLYGGGGLLLLYTLVFLWVLASRYTLTKLDREWGRLGPDRAKFEALSKEYGELENTGKAIESLTRPFSWSKKLHDLSEAMVWGIWLQELSLEERYREGPFQMQEGTLPERRLILTGSAASLKEDKLALVSQFIRSLKQNPDFFEDFVEVELESSRRRSIQALDVMDFKIICTFREGSY